MFSIPAYSDTIALSELDEETRVYIQRGNTGQNVDCYDYLVKMLEQQNPAFDPANYYVTFDDPDVKGLALGAIEAGEYYTCEGGVLTSWDAGDPMVLMSF